MDELNVRAAGPKDFLAVSILLNTSFEGSSEAALVKELRDQDALALELVAVQRSTVVGHIAFPRLESPETWIALAPVSVRWDRRARGIGSRLVLEGLDRLRRDHVPAVVVLGDPEFYHRFGFSVEAACNLKTPYPSQNFMLYPLADHTAGSKHEIVYPRAFRYL
jgi:putative acetyltransferase